MKFRSNPCLLFSAVAAGAVALSASAFGQAAQRNNPTSKLYVAELTGESQVDTGDKILPLKKDAVFSPEGSVFETKPNSTDALVLSNGTALYVGPQTRFEVSKFLQEPFSANRTDLDVEPSVSHTVIHLTRGALGVCTSKMVAGSSMSYRTPEATITVRGKRVVIQTSDNETRVALLEGDVTVVGDGSTGSENLQPGQIAIIKKATAESAATVEIQPIPDADNTKLDEMVSLACLSRRTVYFESVERAEGAELQPVRTIPANQPRQFTVSPSRIQ
jgi:hypothetical protein